MSVSSDSAEQIVKMSLDGVEVAMKIAGNGVKDLTELLITVLKNTSTEYETGRLWLKQAMREGKNVTFFELKQEDLKEFTRLAKQYGVHWTAIKNKAKANEPIELLVDTNDALKVQHIIEKFKLAAVLDGTGEKTDEPETEKQGDPFEDIGKTKEPETELTGAAKVLQEVKAKDENPTSARTEKDGLSESGSERQDSAGPVKKPSVRQRLREIAEQQKASRAAAEKGEKVVEAVKGIAEKAKDRGLEK